MQNLTEAIISRATDPVVAFTAATVFGYCLYKLIVITSRRSSPVRITREDSDEDINMIHTDNHDNHKLVLVIRTDLKMGKGKIAAQCSHAAVAAYKAARKHPKLLQAWEECGQAKIILKVDNEAALMEIAEDAKAIGLLSNVVQDAGHTQIPAGSRTVCGVGPGPARLIDEVTGHLKLF